MQRQLNGVYEQIVIPPVLTVVVRPVVDDLPDDLLHPPTDAVERPIEAALHGQPALGAVALAARWEWAVDKRAQLVLPVLHLMCMQHGKRQRQHTIVRMGIIM